MKNDIRLVRPNLELKEKALAYRKEHFEYGEMIICGSELFDKTEFLTFSILQVPKNVLLRTLHILKHFKSTKY